MEDLSPGTRLILVLMGLNAVALLLFLGGAVLRLVGLLDLAWVTLVWPLVIGFHLDVTCAAGLALAHLATKG